MSQDDDLSSGKTGVQMESPQKREGRGILRTLSHEMRTPLNNIIGFADMMSAEMLGPMSHPQYREYAEDIRKSGQSILDLLNEDRKSTRLNSSHRCISYAVFCLKKKKIINKRSLSSFYLK